jgi:hypothetical protein
VGFEVAGELLGDTVGTLGVVVVLRVRVGRPPRRDVELFGPVPGVVLGKPLKSVVEDGVMVSVPFPLDGMEPSELEAGVVMGLWPPLVRVPCSELERALTGLESLIVSVPAVVGL